MYGYIYKTTNLINNKIYIGQRKGTIQDPNYYGSGQRLRKALKKYGKDNFKCEVIEWCDTFEDIQLREKYWIEFYNSRDQQIGYNLAPGGLQNPAHKLSPDEIKQRSAALSKRNKTNWQNTEYRDKLIKILTQNGYNTHHTEEHKQYLREHPFFKGCKHTEQTKAKMRQKKIDCPSPSQWTSELNPALNGCWYNNGVSEKVINDISKVPDGWNKGRLKRHWYTNGVVTVRTVLPPDETFVIGMKK